MERVLCRISIAPELDVSPELQKKDVQLFQQLIGMLRWACELGRIDILFEVSLLSSHLALPREGHLEAAFAIFQCLAKHDDAPLKFDPKVIEFDEQVFIKTDWKKSIYGDIHEELPVNAKTPRGNPVNMSCFVDASHAGDLLTRRSHTGYIIFLNNAPIDWFSKKQNTVETSTFGAELVALRTATEKVRALRIKLRMLGIPVVGPTSMFCDNDSVVKSTAKVEARLNKKHQAICWHAVREACAAGWILVGKEPSVYNLADLFTKLLSEPRRKMLLQHIYINGSYFELPVLPKN